MTEPPSDWQSSGATAATGGMPDAPTAAEGAVGGASAYTSATYAGAATAGPTTGGATASGSTTYSPSHVREASELSVGEIMSDISRNLSTLMRQEVQLAKAELKQEAAKAAQGAGMLGGAGLSGYFLILFLSLALAWALSGPIGAGLAHLIVAVLWGIAAAVLFVLGRKRLQQVNPKPEQTVETVSEIPSALKPSS